MSNTLEIVFVIDRSGSMYGSENDIIGGFNSMLREQQAKDQTAFVSVVLFSDSSKIMYDRVNLAEVKPMSVTDYAVGGNTALLDALGDAISHIRNIHKYARQEDVPTKTLFVVMTDGEENSSRRYDHKEIKKLVCQQQEQFRWEFIFMGADIDAFASAQQIGVQGKRSVAFFKRQDSFVNCFRATGKIMDHMSETAPDESIDDAFFCDILKIFNG